MDRRALSSWLMENAWAHVDFSAPMAQRRKTALGLVVGLGIVGIVSSVVPLLRGGEVMWQRGSIFWIVALILGAGLISPIGRLVYCGIMGATGLIALFINAILLGAMFYLAITPASLIAKTLSKDLLNRKGMGKKATSRSSWTEHAAPSAKQQYHHLS